MSSHAFMSLRKEVEVRFGIGLRYRNPTTSTEIQTIALRYHILPLQYPLKFTAHIRDTKS